jgi:hypothetical protein
MGKLDVPIFLLRKTEPTPSGVGSAFLHPNFHEQGDQNMPQHIERQTDAFVQLSRREMEEVLGGAQVDYFLKLKTVEGDVTSYVGTANGGVWKTTNF